MADSIRILLAEDDVNLGFVIRDNLEQRGFEVDLCANGVMALEHFQQNNYDICILDVMMPKMDGFSLAEKIRSTNQQIPILFLTAKTMKEDRIRGFMLGGDDYITKPFNIEELILRIKVFVKRSETQEISIQSLYQLSSYQFDYENLSLECNEFQKTLTQMEADVLRYLCDRKGEIVKREEILKAVWGDDDYFNGRSLDVFISRLRKYLSQDEKVKITNHHGVGFKLNLGN